MGRVVSLVVTSAICSLAVVRGAIAQPLTMGEKSLLQSYVGQTYGSFMADFLRVNSPTIIMNNTSVCAGLSSAIGSQLVAKGGNPQIISVANPSEVASAIQAHLKAPAILLAFGGQASLEENYALAKATLQELATANYPGPIFLHLRVWVPKLPERAAKEDQAIATYLANKQNVFTVTLDPQNAKALIQQVSINGDAQKVARVVQDLPMHSRWVELFRRN